MPPYVTTQQFVGHWQGVRLVTLEILEILRLSDPVLPGGRTVAETFHHIGAHEFFAARGVFGGRWNPLPGAPDMDWDAHRTHVCANADAVRAWLQETHGLTQRGLAGQSECLQQLTADNPWFDEMPGWLQLHHAYQNEVHHRGQLTVLMKRLGLELPTLYAEERSDFWEKWRGL